MIDPNEAPEGFVAKPGDTCDGCWFFANNEQGCPDVECHQSSRKDGEDVIFIPREKSNIGELAEAKAEIERLQKFATVNGVSELESELKRWQDIAAQYSQEREHNANEALANKHAVNNLTIELADLIRKNAELEKRVENQKGRIRYLEGATSHATGTPLSKAKDEAARWRLAHDQVCRKFADCENARDENAKLWEQSQDEAARWKAACLERDELIAKLKAQLTTALEAIARMR